METTENASYFLSGTSKYEDVVKLPAGENPPEWIAYNLFNFHKQVSMLYGTIREKCTPETCPKMTAGKKFEFLWSTDQQPIELPAPHYIDRLLDWVQEQLDDENVFPARTHEVDFPPYFLEVAKKIAKRLLRVYAHIYHHHTQQVRLLQEEPHMTTSMRHFIYFIQTFELISKEDLEPLEEFILKFP